MNSKRYSDKLYEVREVSDLKDIITQSTSLFGDKTAYLVKNQRLGRFVPITYRQVREDMDAYGTRLIDMGLKGKKIAVIGESGYYWILTYFATVAGVGSIVPLDKNLPRDEILSLAQRAEADDESILKAMMLAKKAGITMMVHAENADMIAVLQKYYLDRGKTDPVYHYYSRPPVAEDEATSRAIYLAKMADCPLFVVFGSTPKRR